MRLPAGLLLILAIAACAPVPPPAGNAGYEDYGSYMRRRTAEAGAAPAAAPQSFSPEVIGSAIDAAEGGSRSPGSLYGGAAPGLAGDRPRGGAPAGILEQSGEIAGSHATISDENDFSAVSARRSRESDAEFIAQNRANYTVIPPQPLPSRNGSEGPNIVQFALSTSHPPGVSMYRRSALRLKDPVAACAQFGSPDLAQEAFLASGGPDRDRKGLDPDGDGFACGWDPRPFRAVR